VWGAAVAFLDVKYDEFRRIDARRKRLAGRVDRVPCTAAHFFIAPVAGLMMLVAIHLLELTIRPRSNLEV
jgi:hypothetical protein